MARVLDSASRASPARRHAVARRGRRHLGWRRPPAAVDEACVLLPGAGAGRVALEVRRTERASRSQGPRRPPGRVHFPRGQRGGGRLPHLHLRFRPLPARWRASLQLPAREGSERRDAPSAEGDAPLRQGPGPGGGSAGMFGDSGWATCLHCLTCRHPRIAGRPGGNPGADGWLLQSTPIHMPPRRVGICGRFA